MADWRNLILSRADAIGLFIKERVLSEIRRQGHITDVAVRGYSSTLEDSIEWVATDNGSSILISLYGNDYILQMDEGVRPEDVSYDPRDALEFARRIKPGLSDKLLEAYLRNLIRHQQKFGVPTPASFKFSETGRRKNFLEEVGGAEDRENIYQLFNLFTVSEYFVNKMVKDYENLLK